MKHFKSKRNLVALVLIVIVIVLAYFVFVNNDSIKQPVISDIDEIVEVGNVENKPDEVMDLVVYLQDKDEVITNDCGITYPKNIQVPKTKAVADASLEYLFESELSQYGNYESVIIKDGVAIVTVSNENDPTGLKLSALSSCESRHLFAVMIDTLTQYESIESVELHSPTGKIEF